MRYKIMVKGAAYKAARTAKLYTAQIYRIVYSTTYTADVDVTYVANASYTVALEEHVTAGSVTVSE